MLPLKRVAELQVSVIRPTVTCMVHAVSLHPHTTHAGIADDMSLHYKQGFDPSIMDENIQYC